MKKKKTKKNKKKISKFSIFLICVDFCAVICFFVAYGPFSFFRDWLVSTALTTMDHKYFAYVLYSEEYVKEIANNNVTIENTETTNISMIDTNSGQDTGVYSSVYDEQVLKRTEGNDLYKIIPVEGKTYEGHIIAVYDPSRVGLTLAKYLEKGGQKTSKIAKDTGAKIAINGGGFGRKGKTVIPSGLYIEDGKILYGDDGNLSRIIGFNEDNILVLMWGTAEDAVKAKIRDSVDFGPFLVVNGQASTFKGDGGYGKRPRTAIGQRQDGIVLLVVIDGKNGLSGISMPDLTELFVKYGAFNAANLDGGGSSSLVVEQELYNEPRGWDYTGERYVPNAWIVK